MSIGYCQGLHMLAAIILEVMEKSEQNSLKVTYQTVIVSLNIYKHMIIARCFIHPYQDFLITFIFISGHDIYNRMYSP